MTVPVFRLDGQIALVIGGTSGIGKAIALGYAQSGARVVVSGRDAGKLERAVAEIGNDAHGYAADVSDLAELRGLVGIVLAHHGRIYCAASSSPARKSAAICSGAAAARW